MAATYLLVMSILYFCGAILSYHLTASQLLLLGTLAYGIEYISLEGPRRRLASMITLGVLALGGFVYFSQVQQSILLWKEIEEFVLGYYQSMTLDNVYIDLNQQAVLIGIIGFVFTGIFRRSNVKKKFVWFPPVLVFAFACLVFLGNSANTNLKLDGFFSGSLGSILYYYIQKNKNYGQIPRWRFYSLALLVFVCVFGMATYASTHWPNPFGMSKINSQVETSRQKEKVVEVSEPETEEDKEETKSLQLKESQEEYKLQESWEFTDVNLFKINSQASKYIEANTYEDYEDGQWTNEENLEVPYPVTLTEDIEDSGLFYKDRVQIVYQNLETDYLLKTPIVESYDLSLLEASGHSFSLENTFWISDTLMKSADSYRMDVLVPRYGSKAFEEYIDTKKVLEEAEIPDFGYSEEDNQRIRELAENISREQESDYQIVKAIETYLKRQYVYDTQPGLSASSPIIDFLFVKKRGFCQQFATAMNLLVKELGMTSRLVSGYVIHSDSSGLTLDKLTNPYQEIKAKDAHAWVEVYFEDYGWVQFDPTPGETNTLFAKDTMNESLEQETEDEVDIKTQTGKTQNVSIFIVLLLAILIILFSFILYGFRRHYILKHPSKRLMIYYHWILEYLALCQLVKFPYETLREYSKRVKSELNTSPYRFEDFLETFEKYFYNGEEVTDQTFIELNIYLQSIRERARRQAPVWVYSIKVIQERFVNYQ